MLNLILCFDHLSSGKANEVLRYKFKCFMNLQMCFYKLQKERKRERREKLTDEMVKNVNVLINPITPRIFPITDIQESEYS